MGRYVLVAPLILSHTLNFRYHITSHTIRWKIVAVAAQKGLQRFEAYLRQLYLVLGANFKEPNNISG